MVDFLLLERRVRQFRSQIAIVRQQQYTGRVTIQTADGVDTFMAGIFDKVHDRSAILRVIDGGHAVFRLVE